MYLFKLGGCVQPSSSLIVSCLAPPDMSSGIKVEPEEIKPNFGEHNLQQEVNSGGGETAQTAPMFQSQPPW